MRCPLLLGAVAALAVFLAAPPVAHAQPAADAHVYVVATGDTLTRVARRLGVAPRALAAANGLAPPFALRIGRRLRVPPGADAHATVPAAPPRQAHGAADPPAGVMPHRRGFVTIVRARDGAELATSFVAASPALRVRVAHLLRARNNTERVVHPRLLRLLAAVSDHFGGRPITLLSAFRPRGRDASRPRSQHSRGYAVDVRIAGVAAAEVQRFCVTLPNAGCGLYSTARFVHLDVRQESAEWADRSPWSARSHRLVPEDGAAEESVAEVVADAAPVAQPGRR